MVESAAYVRRGAKGGAALAHIPGGLGSGVTGVIACDDLSSWTGATANGPHFATVNRLGATPEEIEISSVSGNNITIAARGLHGTADSTHDSNVTIELTSSPRDFDEANLLVSRILGIASTSRQRLAMNLAATAFDWVDPIVFDVKEYGAVGDGVADDSAAIEAANAAAHAATYGGIVWFPPGHYLNTTAHTISKTTVSVGGAGSGAVKIVHTGTGDCFRVKLAAFVVTQAGRIKGVTITGTSSANGAGVHMGDIIGFGFDDVVIENFTHASGTGLWLDNTTDFTERTTALGLHLNNNTVDLRFTVNGGDASFGFGKWIDLKLNVNSAQIGVSVEDTANVYDNIFAINCNVEGGVGNTAKVFSLIDSALVDRCTGSIHAEQTSGTGATFRATGASTIWDFMGFIDGGSMTISDSGFVFRGGHYAAYTQSVNGALAVDVTPLAGNDAIVEINLSANVTSMTVTGGVRGQTVDFVFIQDGTGGRTVVLPAAFKYAGGAAPSLTTTANHRDILSMYSNGASWFPKGSPSLNVS